MTTITVTYNLPEDKGDFDLAQHAPEMQSAIADALNVIRNHQKHGVGNPDLVLQEVRMVLMGLVT